MRLLIFLGNPGAKFEKTRHNAGFLCGEFLRENFDAENWHFEKKFAAELSAFEFENRKILLARPQNFMNLSGEATLKIKSFFQIAIENLTIFFDDKDLPFGEIRWREKGSDGGHRGARDIFAKLKTDEIARCKIGIESRDEILKTKMPTENFVLQKFETAEIAKLNDEIFPRIFDETVRRLREV